MGQDSKKRFGQILCEQGYIDRQQLQKALDMQKKERRMLGQILLDLGYITSDQLYDALDIQRRQLV